MEADMSAAAIDVHVGAALDPRPLHGVAHFLEHMLF
jgi:secreted Zn-dependent insulinase-like peptidase